jgi:hypothetical protein
MKHNKQAWIVAILFFCVMGGAVLLGGQQQNFPNGGSTFTGGTITSPILGANGSCAAPTYSYTNGTTNGLVFATSNTSTEACASAIAIWAWNSTYGLVMPGGSYGIGFTGTTDPTGTADMFLERAGAKILGVGGNGDFTGAVVTADFQSRGTKFTTNGGCGESAGTITGGGSAGTIGTVASTSCTTIITINGPAALNGWACQVEDITTAADRHNPSQSASTTTTVTIVSGTIVSGDTLLLGPCQGY